MFTREKIFAVYEKPEASDPADRVVLVREGFSFGAFIFNVFWLVYKRLWLVMALYFALAVIVAMACQMLQVSEATQLYAQTLLQVLLAYHARDLEGWTLRRRGYRLAGILAAETEMHATRRYYEFAA